MSFFSFFILIFSSLSGWFLLLSSIIGFWRVKRWEQTVTVTSPPTVEQLEEDQQLRQNLQRIFGIPFSQRREHQDEETLSERQVERDLQAAGL